MDLQPSTDDTIARRGRLAELLRAQLEAIPGLRWRSLEIFERGSRLEARVEVDGRSLTGPAQRAALVDRLRRALPSLAEVAVSVRPAR